MRFALYQRERGTECFNLWLGQRHWLSRSADQREHSGYLKHAHSLKGTYPNKDVAGKKRQLQVHPAAVLPEALSAIERQEGLDLPQREVLSDGFFVA